MPISLAAVTAICAPRARTPERTTLLAIKILVFGRRARASSRPIHLPRRQVHVGLALSKRLGLEIAASISQQAEPKPPFARAYAVFVHAEHRTHTPQQSSSGKLTGDYTQQSPFSAFNSKTTGSAQFRQETALFRRYFFAVHNLFY